MNCEISSREGVIPRQAIRLVALLVLVGSLAFSASAAAEGRSFPANSWVVMENTSPRPGFRGWHQVSYDLESKEVVLFGGSADTYRSDTWTYSLEKNLWRMQRPHPDPTGPCRRDMHNLVYDPVGQRHWLFNGIAYKEAQPGCADTETGSRSGVWTYDRANNTWTKISGVLGVHSRLAPGMAYNPDDRSFLEFGGSQWSTPTNTTFRFDIGGKAWRELKPAKPLPRPRINIEGGLVYDKARKVFVLFGGKRAGSLDDTWLFDPRTITWHEMKPAISPPAREIHAMAYDEVNGVAVLFGGRDSRGKPLNDTWVYNTATNAWTQLTGVGDPPSLMHHSAVYDPHHGVVIVVTGRQTLAFKYVPGGGR